MSIFVRVSLKYHLQYYSYIILHPNILEKIRNVSQRGKKFLSVGKVSQREKHFSGVGNFLRELERKKFPSGRKVPQREKGFLVGKKFLRKRNVSQWEKSFLIEEKFLWEKNFILWKKFLIEKKGRHLQQNLLKFMATLFYKRAGFCWSYFSSNEEILLNFLNEGISFQA